MVIYGWSWSRSHFKKSNKQFSQKPEPAPGKKFPEPGPPQNRPAQKPWCRHCLLMWIFFPLSHGGVFCNIDFLISLVSCCSPYYDMDFFIVPSLISNMLLCIARACSSPTHPPPPPLIPPSTPRDKRTLPPSCHSDVRTLTLPPGCEVPTPPSQ